MPGPDSLNKRVSGPGTGPGSVPGPDSVNRRVSGPGTEPGSVPGLARLKWAICKRGYRVLTNVY